MKRGRRTYSSNIGRFSSARKSNYLWMICFCLFLFTLQGCTATGERAQLIPTNLSVETASLREEIIRQAKALQYSDETAVTFTDMVLSWKNAAKPAITSYKSIIEKARLELQQGTLSQSKFVQVERSTAAKIALKIRKEITANEDIFDLDDIVGYRAANCLGYAQLFYMIGRSVGLSIKPVGVLELQKTGTLPEGTRHICCMVVFNDNSEAMVNLPPPAFTSKPFTFDTLYEKYDNYYKLRNKSNPLNVYRKIQILDENGLIAHVHNNRGINSASQNKLQEAIEQYTKAIDLNPAFADAWNNQGIALRKCNEPNNALSAYNRAIELDPDYAEAYNNRALVLAKSGQYIKALSDYTKAAELHPKFAEAYNNRATTYHQLGRLEQAIREYSRAIELKPELTQAYYNRGTAYGQLGKYKKAISDFSKALEYNPHIEQAYINRGLSFAMLSQYDAAKRDLLRAIELNPSSSTVQLVGKISKRMGLDLQIENSAVATTR